MKALLAQFKKLPPELRMLLAMAGLGTPAGAIYLLHSHVFPGVPMRWLIFGVAGVVGLIGLIVYFISKGFARGARNRSRRMAAELGREDQQGPVSVDIRASIRANNEKFFNAIRDMRKNLGISVYDLPWYIVIGDSGCGKTRLINNGGLTFSTGRPEGYQLGTLNYNWWFTEDAVFVDMAGRLCNPKEDADHKEWQAFLDTIGRGRKGFPINGAVVCVSAEHLLQDSPEKHEADANTALERLREMQSKLGVTFATYLVITKCDKILGFMQFFDRAERDITVKNQIFGWSKPGPFNELRDPEQFDADFGEVYARLNELRHRRLSDDASEVDLGLAYGFPEEFRELRDPLRTYIRTLFPMIRNPRAIKNLIFRGIYFTSATQEGAIILKHLTERLGAEAASQFPTLDALYPEKRPLFVKDVLFRKMFPEHGLVFRNEDDVIRNRMLAKILKFGSLALAVMLITAVVWSSVKLERLIVEPRRHAVTAVERASIPEDALSWGGQLARDIESLRQNWFPAFVLSFGIGADRPIRDLSTVRARLFEDGVLRRVFADLDQALREPHLSEASQGSAIEVRGTAYLDALEPFLILLACREERTTPASLTYERFRSLCGLITPESAPRSVVLQNGDDFQEEARHYFEEVRRRNDWPNLARLLSEDGRDPMVTARQALANAHRFLERYATLDDQNPHPIIREWMRLHRQGRTIEERYARMLAAANFDPDTQGGLQELKSGFLADFDAFQSACDELAWRGKSETFRTTIKSLREAIKEQRQSWLDRRDRLAAALAICSSSSGGASLSAMVAGLATGDEASAMPGLDRVFWNSMKSAGLTDMEYRKDAFEHLDAVREVEELFSYMMKVNRGDATASDTIVPTSDTVLVRSVIQKIRDALAAAQLEGAGDETTTPATWIRLLNEHLDRFEEDRPVTSLSSRPSAPPWRPDELAHLHTAHFDWVERGAATQLLATIESRLNQAAENPDLWGLADLYPLEDRGARIASVYSIPLLDFEDKRRSSTRQDREPEPEKPRKTRRSDRSSRSKGARPSAGSRSTRKVTPGASRLADKAIPACASREFMDGRMMESADLFLLFREFNEDLYIASTEGTPLHERCLGALDRAGRTYISTYTRNWIEAYSNHQLSVMERLTSRAENWTTLAEQLRGGATGALAYDLGGELQASLEQILAALPFWHAFEGENGLWELPGLQEWEWATIADWFRGALNDHRPSQGGMFFDRATPPLDAASPSARSEPPWQQVAGRFVQAWLALTSGISDQAHIPRTFDRSTPVSKPIPWGGLESIRRQTGMVDEKLTGRLVSFEILAQQALSNELSNALLDIQDRHLKGRDSIDGWPFLGSGPEGKDELATVEFADFRRLLVEVDRAREVLKPLEDGLPEQDLMVQERRAFYQNCSAWIEFIGLREKPEGRELLVEVKGEDPMVPPFGKERPEETPQYCYNYVELDLGLEAEAEPTVFREGPFRFATEVQGKLAPRRARWRWTTRTDRPNLGVRLVDGHKPEDAPQQFPEISRVLGRASPLAFCAYLQRHGITSEDRRVWIVSHAFDLVSEFESRSLTNMLRWLETKKDLRRRVGEKYVFTLDRPMPAPIRPLKRVPSTARSAP